MNKKEFMPYIKSIRLRVFLAKSRRYFEGIIDLLGFTCVILSYFFILTLFIVIVPRVLNIEISGGDIGFFIIIFGGAMNYILYNLTKKNE